MDRLRSGFAAAWNGAESDGDLINFALSRIDRRATRPQRLGIGSESRTPAPVLGGCAAALDDLVQQAADLQLNHHMPSGHRKMASTMPSQMNAAAGTRLPELVDIGHT